MSKIPAKLSSNIASVLFSKNSPLSICLHLIRQGNSVFEKVTLRGHHKNAEFFVAQLALGHHFYQRTILLKVFHQNDLAERELARNLLASNSEINCPFPPLLTFHSENQEDNSIFPPLFFCSEKDVFFHAHCEVCHAVLIYDENHDSIHCKYCLTITENRKRFLMGGPDSQQNREALFLSFGKVQGPEAKLPCITCDNHKTCFTQHSEDKTKLPAVFENIHIFSQSSFSLYAFEYFPLSLKTYFKFVSGNQQKDILDLELDNELCTIRSALNKKLHMFIGICNIALNLTSTGFEPDEFMIADNIQVDFSDNHHPQPSLLPISLSTNQKETCDVQGFLKIKKRVNEKNDRNTIIDVFFYDEAGNTAVLSLGDIVDIQYNTSRIPFIVKQKTSKTVLLETLGRLNNDLESAFLTYYSDKKQEIKYKLQNNHSKKKEMKKLGKLYFDMLLSNSVLGEIEINHALNIIRLKIEKLGNAGINESILNNMIRTTPALSVIFRQENTLFNPEIGDNHLLPDIEWSKLILLGLYLIDIELWQNPTDESVILFVKDEIDAMLLKNTPLDLPGSVDEIDEAELIKSALNSLIDDSQWLDSVLNQRNFVKEPPITDEIPPDKTIILSKINANPLNDVDATLIMSNKKSI